MDYKIEKEKIHTRYCVCVMKQSTTPMTTRPSRVLRLRGETEHETNDNVTIKTKNTFNTANMNTHTRVRSSLVLTWLKFHLCESSHDHHMMAYLFDNQSSIVLYFFIFSFMFNLLHLLLHFFHYLEGSSDTTYFV